VLPRWRLGPLRTSRAPSQADASHAAISTGAARVVRLGDVVIGARVHVRDADTIDDVCDLTAPAPVEPGDVIASSEDVDRLDRPDAQEPDTHRKPGFGTRTTSTTKTSSDDGTRPAVRTLDPLSPEQSFPAKRHLLAPSGASADGRAPTTDAETRAALGQVQPKPRHDPLSLPEPEGHPVRPVRRRSRPCRRQGGG
jgi:hypothetical protein